MCITVVTEEQVGNQTIGRVAEHHRVKRVDASESVVSGAQVAYMYVSKDPANSKSLLP